MTTTTPQQLVTALKTLREAALTMPGIIGQRTAAIIETAWIRVEAAEKIARNYEAGQLMTFEGAA
jgi:hypothetical protein